MLVLVSFVSEPTMLRCLLWALLILSRTRLSVFDLKKSLHLLFS